MGIIAIRCEDLPGRIVSKTRFTMPLAIIPGPGEPADLDPYFQPIVEEFKTLQAGMKVKIKIDGVEQEEDHTPILGTLYADAPARAKLAKVMSSAVATLGCQFCWLNGTSVAGTTRFLGYLEPVATFLGHPQVISKKFQMGVEDAERQLTNAQQRDRAESVQALVDEGGIIDPGIIGAHGNPSIFKELDHLDRNLCWAPPFFHMVFLGPFKHLLAIMVKGDEKKNPDMKKFKLQGLKELEKLESQFMLTGDIGRPYEPMDSLRMYLIEHCVRFMDVYSAFLFNEEVVGFAPLTNTAKKAWGHLRRGIHHFLRLHEELSSTEDLERWEEQRNAAKNEFIEFGKIMQTVSSFFLLSSAESFS